MAMGLEQPVALRELCRGADVRGAVTSQEVGADAAQLGVGDIWHRPLVQHVAPRHDRVRQAGGAQSRHGGVAVGDVQRMQGGQAGANVATWRS